MSCTHTHLPGYQLSLFSVTRSQPPESHIDDQHDKKHSYGRKFGVSGTHVQVLRILTVLLGQTGQVVGLGIQSCWRERAEKLIKINPTGYHPDVTATEEVSLEQLEEQQYCMTARLVSVCSDLVLVLLG